MAGGYKKVMNGTAMDSTVSRPWKAKRMDSVVNRHAHTWYLTLGMSISKKADVEVIRPTAVVMQARMTMAEKTAWPMVPMVRLAASASRGAPDS